MECQGQKKFSQVISLSGKIQGQHRFVFNGRCGDMISMPVLKAYIERKAIEKFFGTISIHMEDGKVIFIEERKTIKEIVN